MPRNEPYKPWHIILQPNADTNSGGLWLGDYSAALDKKSINSQNIRTVITAATGLKVSYTGGINHKILQLYDCETENISRYFEDTYNYIAEGLEMGNVYVHCFAGVSRSATIVISYLMKKFQWSLSQALALTKKKRKYINPNPGFMRQLRKYERQLFNPEAKIDQKGSSTKKIALERPTFLEGFQKYTPNRSVNVKENKEYNSSPKDLKKSLLRSAKPFLVQDINRIYVVSGQKKGLSLAKSKKLPELNSSVNRYI